MSTEAEPRIFRDRREAGQSLADALESRELNDPVVLGLPCGGMTVAFEVAEALDAPLDVLVAYRIETSERYRRGREPVAIEDRTVVVVDDGLARGATLRAALRAVRARRPRRVVLAAPFGSEEAITLLGSEADEVVCVSGGRSETGVAYVDRETSDDEVRELLGGARYEASAAADHRPAAIASPEPGAMMAGDLVVPKDPTGLVVFAHCSGSSRYSPRNHRVAAILNRTRLATLLLDLLTPQEELDRRALLDIGRAARRLLAAAAWASEQPELRVLPTGYFGAGSGAGAALWAAADASETVSAVVSRGGRPELAGPRLADVHASVLLIAGGREAEVVDVNRQALLQLRGRAQLNIFPRATQRFREPGALDEVARLAADWFNRHLAVA
jgi:putative phosphoribosyl transferase